MQYIQSPEHLINYFKKVYRDRNIKFTSSDFDLLINFYFWSENYTGGKCTDRLTWELRNINGKITQKDLERVKDDYVSSLSYDKKLDNLNRVFLDNVARRVGVPGVYFIYNKQKELLYVGRSFDLSGRILSSISERLSGSPYYVRFINTKTKADATILEPYFISKEKPSMNKDMTSLDKITIKIDVKTIPQKSGYITIFYES